MFIRDRSKAKKVLIIFWKLSVECISQPNTSNGTPDQTKTAGPIFMKILPEMYIGIRKSSLQFGIHPYSIDSDLWSTTPGGDTCAVLSTPLVLSHFISLFLSFFVIYLFIFFFAWYIAISTMWWLMTVNVVACNGFVGQWYLSCFEILFLQTV